MARAVLTGKINLQNSAQVDVDIWTLNFIFSDNEGAFLASSISIGDMVYLDTSGYELATVSRYKVLSIESFDDVTGVVDCTVQFDDNNIDPIDPAYCIGTDGAIGKPTPRKKFNFLPSPGAQSLPDKFNTYPRDADFLQRLDLESIWARESFTLDAANILDGFVVLAHNPIPASVDLKIRGAGVQFYGDDYVIQASNQCTFPSELSSGDRIQIQYQY
jgi:hypothetical protein